MNPFSIVTEVWIIVVGAKKTLDYCDPKTKIIIYNSLIINKLFVASGFLASPASGALRAYQGFRIISVRGSDAENYLRRTALGLSSKVSVKTREK